MRYLCCVFCLASVGCASFQKFLERDEARVESWRRGDVDHDAVCVVIADDCRYVPRDAYTEEREAIDEAARDANANWRKERPLAADLVGAH